MSDQISTITIHTHRWTNITAFTQEVANARIWAGFHFRFSTRVGTDMGLMIEPTVLASRVRHYVPFYGAHLALVRICATAGVWELQCL
jgi:hypothetical protein